MRTIAVVFAAALALGAAMPAAQAAQAAQNTEKGGTSLQVQTDSLLNVSDELSARKGGKRHWRGGGRKWHGHHGWRRHGWRGHRGWHGWRGYGWRGYGWRHRYRHCWKVWHRGHLVKVCGWRRW